MGHWTEGVYGDGAAILCDGDLVPVETVVRMLNVYEGKLRKIARMTSAYESDDSYPLASCVNSAARAALESKGSRK